MVQTAAPATTTKVGSLVEWGAVIAGAITAAAISFVLWAFGTTIGLSFVSPWPNSSLSPTFIVCVALFWVLVTQIASYLIGGYIAGRMRSRWVEASPHEVEFRDGLHGLLVWALGVAFSTLILLSAAGSAIKNAADIGTKAAGAAAASGASADPLAYYSDVLLRPRAAGPGAAGAPQPISADARDEIHRVLQRSIVAGRLSEADKTYLAQVVSQRSGLPAPEAQKRVDDTYAEASRAVREAADKARHGAILTGLVTAISLLVALAAAWWAAQRGGEHRDRAIHATLFGDRRRPGVRVS
jgi:hypothetical protein